MPVPGGYPGGLPQTGYPATMPQGPAVAPELAASATAQQVLSAVSPLVQYAIREQVVEGASLGHAIREVTAIAYLMGRGLSFQRARELVESWEVGEKFPGFER